MAKSRSNAVVQPYLFFDGRCDEALEFYRKALGAEVTMLMRFKESPAPGSCPAGAEDKVMHASVRIGKTTLLVSDGQCRKKSRFEGFALTLIAAGKAEAKRRFAALSRGGKVQVPLAETFFSPSFGMVADLFGILWMVCVEK